jgi:hypothetical protein
MCYPVNLPDPISSSWTSMGLQDTVWYRSDAKIRGFLVVVWNQSYRGLYRFCDDILRSSIYEIGGSEDVAQPRDWLEIAHRLNIAAF